MLKNLSDFVMPTLRQVRVAVTGACATSFRHATQVLTRIELWLTENTRRVLVGLRRLDRRSGEWLRSHAELFFIISILFVVVVELGVIVLIAAAFHVSLTPQYTLAMRYSYVFRAAATFVAPIVTFSPPSVPG